MPEDSSEESSDQHYDPFRGSETVTLRELLVDVFEDLIDYKKIKGDPFVGDDALTVESCLLDKDKPLHRVARRGNAFCARLLLEAGANPNSLGDLDMTPLHYAVREGDDSLEVVEVLLEAGARVDIIDELGSSSLRKCSEEGVYPNAKLFRLLRSYWPEVTPEDMG